MTINVENDLIVFEQSGDDTATANQCPSPKDFSEVQVDLSYMKKRGEKSMNINYKPKSIFSKNDMNKSLQI